VRGLEGFKTPFEYEMLLDGVPVHRATLGGVEDDALSNRDQGSATASAQERIRVRLPVTAGLHKLGFTFVMKSLRSSSACSSRSRATCGRQRRLWLAAHRAGAGHGAVRGDGSRRHAGEARHLHVPAFGGRRARGLRGADLGRLARRAYSRSVTETELKMLLDSTSGAAPAAATSSAASSSRSRAC